MTRQELFDIALTGVSEDIYRKTKEQWDHISKPIDGLGDFEDLICRIAAIQNTASPEIENRVLMVFCADNGIVSRGVTQSDQEITKMVAIALGVDRSSSSCLARSIHTKIVPVDIGINSEERIDGVIDRKIRRGTEDFLERPAMTEEEVLKAIETGIELTEAQVRDGVQLIATGEMGIGNTTTSAAVLGALLGLDAERIVGRGAGLDDERLYSKKTVVKMGIEKYAEVFANAEDEKNRCFEILRCLGGLDIAALCGVFIGGAKTHVPVVIDGVISAVAALLAERMVPGAKEVMIPSHLGREAGSGVVLGELGLTPVINGNMALGEGTGALMMIPLLDQAMYFYKYAKRFWENGIEDYERFT